VVGSFAFWVGLLDVLSAAGLQYKLIGLAFAVAGLVLLAGTAVLLWAPWWRTRGRIAAVAAGVAGALVGIYLLVMQYRAPGLSPSRLPPFPAWVPWAGIAVASVVGAVLGWTSTKDHAGTQLKWSALGGRLVAGGLSVTVLFAGVQWWYTQQYQPGTIAAALTVTTELKPAASEGDTADPHLFEGIIKVKNVSDTKVQIVASQYLVSEVTHRPRTGYTGINPVYAERQAVSCFYEELAPVTDPECDETGVREYGDFSDGDPRSQDDATVFRYSRESTYETLQLGSIVGDGFWLEPKEESQHNVLVHVPEEGQSSDLRTLELSAWLTVAQGSRLVLEPNPSHGPEMVPQALMSNEEHRDYEQAEQDVHDPDSQAAAGVDSAEDEAHSTEEVAVDVRDEHLQRLAMTKALDENSLGVSEPGTTPRLYPHRYTVVEWPIADLSTLHRLVSGSQAVNTVQVLSMRTYDPLLPPEWVANETPALMEYELVDMKTCITPAGRFEGRDETQEIRRDPTVVCPGMWYSLDDHDRVMNGYERRYQEMVDYQEEMRDFYGLVSTGSGDVVSLTPEAEVAEVAMQALSQVHPLTSDVFRTCAPALEYADLVTRFGDAVQQAFDRHASEMGAPTERAVVDGAPALHDGVAAADELDTYREDARAILGLLCSDEELSDEVVGDGFGADFCVRAADAKRDALQHAHDVGEAVRDHHAVMQRLADGEITARQATQLGAPSLETGTEAADAYREAEDEADGLMADCR